MSGELTSWIASSPMERQHGRDLAKVRQEMNMGRARVFAVATVANEAMAETGALAMTHRRLEMVVPEVAARLDSIEWEAAGAMAHVIRGMAQQW